MIFIKDNNGAATLVGIVSQGYSCASIGFPGIYSGLYNTFEVDYYVCMYGMYGMDGMGAILSILHTNFQEN